MRVQFEFTAEELFDASRRLAAHWKRDETFRWQTAAAFASIAALTAFFLADGAAIRRLVFGTVGGLLGALLGWLLGPQRYRKVLRAESRRAFAQMQSPVCAVALDPVELRIEQDETATLHPWHTVTEIVEYPDCFGIYTRHRYGVIVQDNAFANREERNRFVTTVRERIAATRR